MRGRVWIWIPALLGTLLAASAPAVTIDVTVSSLDTNQVEVTRTGQIELDQPDSNGIFHYSLADLPSTVASTVRWDFSQFDGHYDPDPVISSGFSVLNLLPGTQSFVITVSTVTGPIGAPTTLTSGSAQGGVTDGNNNGATLSTSGPGTAFYTALLDGGDFKQLYAHPKSVTVPAGASGNLSPNEDFGLPGPSFPGPAVAATIGIRFEFDLTGSDRATGSGVFQVEPVPEPSTALLLAFGLLALARRRHS